MTALALLYDAEVYGDNPPTSWADFYDTTKFPGKRGLPTFASGSGAFESALIADGADPSALYPIDIDRAIAKLDTIKGDVLFFDNLPAAVEQIVSDQVTMTILPMSRALEQDRAGGGFEAVWNKHLYSPGTFSIPKNAPNLDVAQTLAAYALTPEAQSSISQALALGPSVEGVELTGDLKWIATTPERVPDGVVVNLEWWGANLQEATERYTEWAAG
jgi:putative spermidine/putrescine transport system substrate-binding protein